MHTLFVVLKLPLDDLEKVKTFFSYTKSLITFEQGKSSENPHFHIIMESQTDANAVRNRITRHFGLNGSKRTITNCRDIESSIIYVLKDFRVKHNTLLSEQELEDYLTATQRVNEVKNEVKKSRKDSFKYLFISQYVPLCTRDYTLYPTEEIYSHINMYILHKFREHNTECLDSFIYRKHFFKLLNYYYPRLMNQIARSWYGDYNLPTSLEESEEFD